MLIDSCSTAFRSSSFDFRNLLRYVKIDFSIIDSAQRMRPKSYVLRSVAWCATLFTSRGRFAGGRSCAGRFAGSPAWPPASGAASAGRFAGGSLSSVRFSPGPAGRAATDCAGLTSQYRAWLSPGKTFGLCAGPLSSPWTLLSNLRVPNELQLQLRQKAKC